MKSPTTVRFLGQCNVLPSQQDAFLWWIEKLLRVKPDIFTNSASAYACNGRRGGVYFALDRVKIRNKPGRLSNGVYVELCLSNNQKVYILDKLAQYAGLKRGRDWDWQAQYRPTRRFIDVSALFDDLENVSFPQTTRGPERKPDGAGL